MIYIYIYNICKIPLFTIISKKIIGLAEGILNVILSFNNMYNFTRSNSTFSNVLCYIDTPISSTVSDK